MGLLDLSNPVLLNVFRRLDTPESFDLCNVTLVCKRFNLLTTPLIYREVNMTPDWPVIMPGANVPPPLRNLVDTINRHPARALCFKSVSFAWNDMTPNWWALTFDLLSKFRSVRMLYLRAGPTFILFYDHMPRFLDFLYFSNYLDQVSFPELHTLTIEDCKLTMKDILKVYTFPSLEHLQINRFNPQIFSALSLPSASEYAPTKITKLGFSWSPTPMGPYIDTLLKNHPKLEDFSWNLDTRVAPIPAAPEAAITQAFSPFQSTIQKMYLSIVEPNSMSPGSSRIEMDFSAFKSLRELTVHDRWIFPPPTGNGRKFNRSQLAEKLPPPLASLTIVFDGGKSLIHEAGPEQQDYSWLLALPPLKSTSLSRLTEVTILELEDFREIPDLEELSRGVQWEYPPAVREAFLRAGIGLKVVLAEEAEETGLLGSFVTAAATGMASAAGDWIRNFVAGQGQ